MKRIMRDERGIALAVAIFALVVVGALVAGAFFAGTQESRIAENHRRAQMSFVLAELGAGQQVASWNPLVNNAMKVYPAASIAVANQSANTGVFSGRLLKLNSNLYLVDIFGQDSVSASGKLKQVASARARVGMITRVQPLLIDIQASLTTQGAANLTGNAAVDGNDHTPPGWTDCNPLDSSKAGIRINGSVSTSGNATVEGDPPVMQDVNVSDKTFTEYGHGMTYDQLAARANIQLNAGNYTTRPSTVGASCNLADPLNWGDGLNKNTPCAHYFPVIHIMGSAGQTTLNGVQGQGILLVDGDLNVQGSYEFFGITIIRGRLKTAGGGSTDAHFWGSVMAQNVDLELQNLSGEATLNYSKCAIMQSLQMTQPTIPMVSRGWSSLF